MFGPCRGVAISVISRFANISLKRQLIYFNCVLAVVLATVFCASSSWCRGLICDLLYEP